MKFSELHPADQIVEIMKRLYGSEMTTISGGNISVKDCDGNIWMTPTGNDKGNLRREDIVCVTPSGEIRGRYKPTSEYPFHLAIYRVRADVKAVVHAHAPALIAFSLLRKPPELSYVPALKNQAGRVAVTPYATNGSQQLADNVAETFRSGADNTILENHGAVSVAKNLLDAFSQFEALVQAATVQINARTLGGELRRVSDKHTELYEIKEPPRMGSFDIHEISPVETDARGTLCELSKRACSRKLFSSRQGSMSVRLPDGSFVITPHDGDRFYLDGGDIVKIKDGASESGKTPSRSVRLHEKIYEQCKWAGSVIVAHSPNIMAFAVSDREFDTALIGESVLVLRNVTKYPFGSAFMQPELLAKEIRKDHPVCIVENDCVVIAGKSAADAYDKLEVLEYSAKALIMTSALGEKVVKLTPEQVRDIYDLFG